jgi:hypothetical protein
VIIRTKVDDERKLKEEKKEGNYSLGERPVRVGGKDKIIKYIFHQNEKILVQRLL